MKTEDYLSIIGLSFILILLIGLGSTPQEQPPPFEPVTEKEPYPPYIPENVTTPILENETEIMTLLAGIDSQDQSANTAALDRFAGD